MESIPTQIRMGPGSITFHTRGSMKGQNVVFMPKSWTFYMYILSKYYFQQLRLWFPWNEYAYYFGRYPDSIKNGDGLHYISWCGAQTWLICPPYVKIQNCEHAWWTSAGKELTSWLSACAILLYAVFIFCVPFLYGVWGKKWNSIVSVPDHCLFIFFFDSQLLFWVFQPLILWIWLCLLDR